MGRREDICLRVGVRPIHFLFNYLGKNMRFKHLATTVALAALAPIAAQAATFANTTFTLLPGTIAGADFSGTSYGGDIAGAFPVALDDATARSYVLGGPDGKFLTLPGQTGTPNGQAFPGAYVEVGFGGNFGANNLLNIYEVGNNAETAQIFLWTNNGGNIQFDIARGASDVITIDLSSYASTLSFLGASAFTKVGIGGLDLNGASKGFDLDAVSISAVPEPETYAMLLAGMGLIGTMARRRKNQQR
jgi:PEP-CTERM motif